MKATIFDKKQSIYSEELFENILKINDSIIGVKNIHKKSLNKAYKTTLHLYFRSFFILSKNCSIYVSLCLICESIININILKIHTKKQRELNKIKKYQKDLYYDHYDHYDKLCKM